jgi:oligopeptide transport system permease protein
MLIPTLLAIYTLTFLLIHATPGSPWSQGEKPVAPRVLERLNAAYGLDKPLWRQYIDYLWNVLHGDFGPSFTQRSRTVTDIISDTFPVSIQLGILSMLIALAFGLTLGTIGALKHNSLADYITGFIAIAGISTPSYVIGSLLVLLFASTLDLVPTGGWDGILSKKIFIPAIALALYPSAVLARYMRSSMLDVLSADYVRTGNDAIGCDLRGCDHWFVLCGVDLFGSRVGTLFCRQHLESRLSSDPWHCPALWGGSLGHEPDCRSAVPVT